MMLVYGDDRPDAEVVIVYGNCQAAPIASLLSAADSPQTGRVYVASLNHGLPGQQPVVPGPEALARCTLYIEQVDERAQVPERTILREGIPRGTPRICFPPLIMNSFWPFETIAAPGSQSPQYPWGRFPLGDLIGMQIARQNLTGDAAYDAYMKLSIERMPDLSKRLDWDMEFLEKRDRQSDVRIGDYIRMIYRGQHIFWTSGHLSMLPIGLLACRLYEMAMPVLGGDLATGLAQIDAGCDPMDGMGNVQNPIHPLIAERLGLAFGGPEMTYKWYDEHWTFRDYITRYISRDETWGHRD
jgi:hypothetical protein